MKIVGVILSGGAGQRLGGVRKADLRMGGVTLLRRVYERLVAQCDGVLLSVAAGTSSPKAAESPDLEVIADDPDGPPGPAAGLFAAIRWCSAHAPDAYVLTVAVDTPFFPSDFSERARGLLGDDVGGIIAAYGADLYPTNVFWRQTALDAALSEAPRHGRGPSLFSLTESAGCLPLDYAPFTAENPFMNVNALPDLLRLSQRK